jgi:hypothetical protein
MPRDTRLEWNADAWSLSPLPALRARAADPLVGRLLQNPRLRLEAARRATPAARRGPTSPLELTVRVSRAESVVVLARHPSGAVTIHPARRERETARVRALEFRVASGEAMARRSAESSLRIFVLRVVGRWTDRALPDLSRAWEETRWEKSGLNLGLVKVTKEALLSGRLSRAGAEIAALPPPPKRSLLLVHGIFSDAESAFRGLATTDRGSALLRLTAHYEGRVYALNHATVGSTPLENARALLDALPARVSCLDSLTHSRGGVVLRTLAEHPSLAKERARKVELSHAILVAAPNAGSELADPSRWEEAVTWIANLVDLFPLSAFSSGLELVSEAIVWMARRAAGAIPGIAALAPDSALLSELDGSLATRASAVSTSFAPPPALLPRLLDAGADLFFRSANDLVVPTEGGFRLGAAAPALPGERILCFGAGGNARETSRHHLNLFDSKETVAFVARALLGEAQPYEPVDVSRDLPAHGARRRAGLGAATRVEAAGRASRRDGRGPRRGKPGPPERLDLVLLPGAAGSATLLASWGRARALSSVATRGGAAGERMRRIIALHERIVRTLDGRIAAPLPASRELEEYGGLLFETLFPPDVRRLYDGARARANGRRLDVVFTSTLDWVADKPWELAYDPARGAFLAAEEVNFVRDVFTAVPEERSTPRRGPLEVLLASAEPRGLARLSARKESRLVTEALAPLGSAGLVRLEELPHATPERLHSALQKRRPDVLHFVGHGVYKERTRTGALVLESVGGGAHEVPADALRRLLAGRGLRLVFLNACETARGGRVDFNRGVAPALAAGGVPAVLANQYSVLDTAATAFAGRFYESLALGRSIGDAAREARIAVGALGGESIGWATPVLFARDPSAVLCAPPRRGGHGR